MIDELAAYSDIAKRLEEGVKLTDNMEEGPRTDLLETILDVVQGQRGQSINELVSLLALSNLLGIISFLNGQDLKFDGRGSVSKTGSSDLKDMAMSLLGSMGGGGQDKKINPALLMNLLKSLSAAENSPEASKPEEKGQD